MRKKRQNKVLAGLLLLSLLIVFTSGCDKYARHDILAFFSTGIPVAHEGEERENIPETISFLHGAYAARQCYHCHVKSSLRLHSSILNTPTFKQCYECHIQSPALTDGKEAVSIPWLKVQPPGSLVLPLKDLCLQCHPPKKISAAHLSSEGPVSDGNCIFCHDPHYSPFQYMLRKKN